MKGQAEFMEIIVSILMSLLLFAILIVIGPTLVGEFAKLLALAGSDAVSREIAGFISISPAATDEINIYFTTSSKKTSYNVKIDTKNVFVEMLDDTKKKLNSDSSKILVDPQEEFSDIQSLQISKKRTETGFEIGVK